MSGKYIARHPFHLDASPWPFYASICAFGATFGGVCYMHDYMNGGALLTLSGILLVVVAYRWWADVVREGTYQGLHTNAVQTGLRYGMLLFIVSEVMFFLAFFWVFFHSSVLPSIEIGGVWPPAGIDVSAPGISTCVTIKTGAMRYVPSGVCKPKVEMKVSWTNFSFAGNPASPKLVGCYQNKTGAMRLLLKGSCAKGKETKLGWANFRTKGVALAAAT